MRVFAVVCADQAVEQAVERSSNAASQLQMALNSMHAEAKRKKLLLIQLRKTADRYTSIVVSKLTVTTCS
jgi:hypothetical protein